MADGATDLESGGLFVGLVLLFSGIAIAKAVSGASSRGRLDVPIPVLPKVPPPMTTPTQSPPAQPNAVTPTTHHTPTDFYAGKINELARSVVRWWPQIAAQASLAGIPPAFAQAWMTIESGGNSCAVGELTATAPENGLPREIGLWQIYNPDDFKGLRVTAQELTAYCVRPAAGQRNPQTLSRPMTSDEIVRHVSAGIQEIQAKRAYANRYLTASGYLWPTTSPDYWSAVKLAHALPVEENGGFAQVAHKLGRSPVSWREFRDTYETIQPRAKFDPAKAAAHQDQDGYFRALENAEWSGFHVVPA